MLPVPRIQICKYPNRRYYDSTHSRHVTLDQIHQLIRDGHDIEVIDSKTRADITAKVLAQIIVELDPPKLGVFPVPMLHRLLRSNEHLVRELAADWSRLVWGPFRPTQWTPDGGRGPEDADVNASARPTASAADEQADLRRAVEELRRELAALRRPHRRSRKARAKGPKSKRRA
jgi:polyhydroxyalkanoate synthesis repressor PhaR